MDIHSSHNADTYLYEMRQDMGSPTDFGVERFTGIMFGKFFCISHHCSYEWKNRYTCQKNTAIGIVKDNNDGCDVQFFVTHGNLRPQWLIPVYAVILIVSLVLTAPSGLHCNSLVYLHWLPFFLRSLNHIHLPARTATKVLFLY